MMTRWKLLSAVAVLSTAIATSVFAQAAIQEPGAYAFYHPDGDVLQTNRPWSREPAGAMAAVPSRANDAYAYMGGARTRRPAANGTDRSTRPRVASLAMMAIAILASDPVCKGCRLA